MNHEYSSHSAGLADELATLERVGSIAVGVAALSAALGRLPRFPLLLLAAGAYGLQRGLTGHCALSQLLSQPSGSMQGGAREFSSLMEQSPKNPPRRTRSRESRVDETLAESFPASDPPATTGATATPAGVLNNPAVGGPH